MQGSALKWSGWVSLLGLPVCPALRKRTAPLNPLVPIRAILLT